MEGLYVQLVTYGSFIMGKNKNLKLLALAQQNERFESTTPVGSHLTNWVTFSLVFYKIYFPIKTAKACFE